MSKKRFDNVWDAIEDTPAQAENMKLRSTLITRAASITSRRVAAAAASSRMRARKSPTLSKGQSSSSSATSASC
jgi:predicted XRE-type DNA-binding protein